MECASCPAMDGMSMARNLCHSLMAIGRFGSCSGCILRMFHCKGPRGLML